MTQPIIAPLVGPRSRSLAGALALAGAGPTQPVRAPELIEARRGRHASFYNRQFQEGGQEVIRPSTSASPSSRSS